MSTSPEPMSPAQVEAARALPTMSTTVAEQGPLITAIEQALAAAGRRHDRARQQLLDEVDWLAGELADRIAELRNAYRSSETAWARNSALLTANAELRSRAIDPLTVWRAYYRDGAPTDGINLGLFSTEALAFAACEDNLRCAQDNPGVLAWWSTEDDPEEPRELAVTLPGAAQAFGTGYFVVPVQVQDCHDPEDGE